MGIALASFAFVAAALAAGLMGFAIQRGGTCTVAAVEEVIEKRRATRLIAMAEASLWVAVGLLLMRALGVLGAAPTGFAISAWTFAGAALLGLGAYVNGACVFGAIARLGSGEWAYALTPLGFFIGSATVGALFMPPAAQHLGTVSPVFAWPWLVTPFVTLLAWRAWRGLRHRSGANARPSLAALRAKVWSPHAATAVIGITFVVTLAFAGATWAYTDALAELARGMTSNSAVRIVLLLALFAGALWGGWTAGRLRSRAVTAVQALRCVAGGALMAWGSLLIPGSNDGLILIGMPLLWPYAWLAFGTMVVVIAGASTLRARRTGVEAA